MRLFIATFLSESSQAALQRFVRAMTQDHLVLRAVPDGTVHITWAFCGDAPDTAPADILAVLRDVAYRHTEIPIAIGTPHVLRAGRRPRLVAADVTTGRSDVMTRSRELAAALRERVPGLEFQAMKTPHVTLARFNRSARPREATAVEAWLASRTPGVAGLPDRIGELQLVRSDLRDQGPAYAIVASVGLGPMTAAE